MNIFKLSSVGKYGRRLAGFIRTTYILSMVVLFLAGGMLIFSVIFVFEGKASLHVSQSVKRDKEKKVYEYESFSVTPSKYKYILTLSSPTIVQSVLLKHKNGRSDLLQSLITFLGIYQILIIFRSLDRHGFFSIEVAKHIKNLGYIYILGWFIGGAKVIYMTFLVKDLTHGVYKLDTSSFEGMFSNIFFGFVLLLIAAIYKKSCQLKEDQEFTI